MTDDQEIDFVAAPAAAQPMAALRALDKRLRECSLHPISASDAYDSYYREMVASALAATAQAAPEGVQPVAPYGWHRIASEGPESLHPWFVLGVPSGEPPPYPAKYRPLYATPQVEAAPEPMTEDWCAHFPKTAAYMVNRLARRVDELEDAARDSTAQVAQVPEPVCRKCGERHTRPTSLCEYIDVNPLLAYIADLQRALAAPLPSAAPVDAPRELIGRLESLRVVLGIDSPETRGWAPVAQREARRVVDAAIAALSRPQAAAPETEKR